LLKCFLFGNISKWYFFFIFNIKILKKSKKIILNKKNLNFCPTRLSATQYQRLVSGKSKVKKHRFCRPTISTTNRLSVICLTFHTCSLWSVLCGMKILYNMIANVTNYSIKYLPRKTPIFYSIKWCASKLDLCV